METMITVMIEVGIALHGGGDPFRRLRIAKNETHSGSPKRRAYETLLKQDKDYLVSATDKLIEMRR